MLLFRGRKGEFIRALYVMVLSISVFFFHSSPQAQEKKAADTKHPVVVIKSNMGVIEIELDAEKAPVTVENFLSYVKDAFYDSTVFHRVIPNFMIQGGGFTIDMKRKETKPPIVNEAKNGLKNRRGTITMARTPEINSATCQFFINLVNNNSLNHKNDSPRGYGYAVFGKVTKGMDVVDKIAAVKTGIVGGYRDVPLSPVIIESVRLKE